jgi:hypothetical protein
MPPLGAFEWFEEATFTILTEPGGNFAAVRRRTGVSR